jgi:inner membrane protein involved in colicin E2 resistance
MSNPLRGFRYLPWIPLIQTALLTVAIATVVDWLVQFGLRVPLVAQAVVFLYSGPLSPIMGFAIAFLLGALAVSLLDRMFNQSITNSGNLWALILCLIVVLLIKSWIIPGVILHSQQVAMIGAVFGVFVWSRSSQR